MEQNGTPKDSAYGFKHAAIVKKRLMLTNSSQHESSSIVNLSSTINLNPVSSDSECSSSVFL